jgi:hypothetical protein
VGTDQWGVSTLVDDDTNGIVIFGGAGAHRRSIAAPDAGLESYIDSFKQVVDRKYNTW